LLQGEEEVDVELGRVIELEMERELELEREELELEREREEELEERDVNANLVRKSILKPPPLQRRSLKRGKLRTTSNVPSVI
jgi:hypothetical protein